MDVAAAMALLAEPMRQRILDRLGGGELSVGDIAKSVPISRPAVSMHLKFLARAGLLTHRRAGRFHFYGVCRDGMTAVVARLTSWARAASPAGATTGATVDEVDSVVASLLRAWPALDGATVSTFTRLQLLGRFAHHVQEQLARAQGITAGDVILLGTLRRLGTPYAANPTRLARTAVLSVPIMLKRLEQLRRQGLIRRMPAPDDGRISLVVLTKAGAELIDRLIGVELARELRPFTRLPIEVREAIAANLRLTTQTMMPREPAWLRSDADADGHAPKERRRRRRRPA